MSLLGPRFTYEDYKLLPEGKRYEVMEGELLVTAARSVEVLTLGQGGLETWRAFPTGSTMTSPLLPGFSLAVDPLLAD